MSFDKKLTKSILCNEIILHIASFGLKKLFCKSYPHSNMRRKKLTYRYDISDKRKKSILCNIFFMSLRDKGGLVWLSKIVVLLTSLTIKVFETFLHSENMIN